MKIRLIKPPLAIPRYRQVQLPTVAAEFTPYAEVEINDENVEPIDFSQVDLVGFTAQVYNVDHAARVSEQFRARGVKTILGGPHATAMPEWSLQHFDAVVAGEVEGLGERIVRDLERGALTGVYRSPAPPDLAIQRLPRRDLLKSEEYYGLNFPIELSRGCTHGCSFCFSSYQFPGFRARPLDKIAEDLAQWSGGIRMVEVVDLHMAADREHLMACCKLFEEVGVQGWYGECTLASLDDDPLLAALERSGCKAVFVGLESIEAGALQSVAKGFNPHHRYKEIIRKVQDHGIFVHAGLIWGLDGQTPESFERTLEFGEEVGLYLASTNLLAYYPGTRTYSFAERKGRLLTDEFRKFDSAHAVVEPDTMTPEEVYENARRFTDRFYSLGSIFRRSFQVPNYRLAHLLDYWALNLIYRAYFKRWGKRLGATTPQPGASPEDADTLPYMGGAMPPIYGLMDRSWRFWERWYAWWETPPAPASGVVTFLILLLLTGASTLGLLAVAQVNAERWPVPWPDPWLAASAFIPACLLSFWVVHRIARSPGKAPLRFLGLALAQAPPLACVQAVPPHASFWRFMLLLLVLTYFMKGWSLIATGPQEHKGSLRAFAFMFYFPTLDFEGSFRLEPKKQQLIRHLPLQIWGFWKFVLGLLLSGLLVYGVIQRWDHATPEPVLWGARLAITYLCLSGIQDWLTAYWRMAGYVVPRGFERPFSFSGPAAIWRGWNIPMRNWLLRHVYVPLGGRERPALAVLATFLVSGLFFEAVLDAANLRASGFVLLFFAVNGVAVALDKIVLEPRCAPPTQIAWRGLSLALSVALFLGTAGWFFAETDRVFQ